VLPGSAAGWKTTATLMPGVTYTKEVRWIRGGPVVTHVITGRRPGGLWALKPVLSGGTVLGREPVTSMQRRLFGQATIAGVNGDYFNLLKGHPSGILLRDGVLDARPNRLRSSLGIAFDGSLRVRRLAYSGTWQVDGFGAHRLEDFNHELRNPPGVGLFTPSWGGRTPVNRYALDAVLAGLPPAVANGYHSARIVRFHRGGGTAIPADGAVLQAEGSWRQPLRREAQPGRRVTVYASVSPLWADVADAIGGGPVLVRRSRAIIRAGEDFTADQLVPRHPRTAVGQLADGRVILVAVDGRSGASQGLRTWEVALEMMRLGAVTAMGFDGGGSTTLAFDGRVLNVPSDGSERPVADGLFVFFYGAYAPRPRYRVFSPNGDGVADVQPLRARIVKRSHVRLRVLGPNGGEHWGYAGWTRPSTLEYRLADQTLVDGRWRWVVESVDAAGRKSRMQRAFVVNKTLGHLRLSRERMTVGRPLRFSFVLTRPSRLRVAIRRADGAVLRLLHAGAAQPRTLAFRWGGLTDGGRRVPPGSYRVTVRAANGIGVIGLRRAITVVR
jgi:Phosphodiester glycosidase/FlgD Ig-like domain